MDDKLKIRMVNPKLCLAETGEEMVDHVYLIPNPHPQSLDPVMMRNEPNKKLM